MSRSRDDAKQVGRTDSRSPLWTKNAGQEIRQNLVEQIEMQDIE